MLKFSVMHIEMRTCENGERALWESRDQDEGGASPFHFSIVPM
jgi:hypothetical protein